MKKRLIITLLILAACLISIYFGLAALSSQDDLYSDRPEGCVGVMPIRQINPIFVEAAPGILFRFDTGSDFSTITQNDLKKLEAAGCKIETMFYPSLGRGAKGQTHFTTRRYRVTLPLYIYSYDTDSLGPNHERRIEESRNDLHNVDFTESVTGFSVLGIDFIEKFNIVYMNAEQAIALYFDRPEGYQDLAKLTPSISPLTIPYLGHRYYMDVTIDRKVNSYFLDTGLQYVHFRLPSAERKRSKRKLEDIRVRDLNGTYDAKVDKNAWIEVGNRAGSQYAYYYDLSNEEDYAFNPYNMFQQNVLLDFKSKALALKPFCVLPKRHFTLKPDSVALESVNY